MRGITTYQSALSTMCRAPNGHPEFIDVLAALTHVLHERDQPERAGRCRELGVWIAEILGEELPTIMRAPAPSDDSTSP